MSVTAIDPNASASPTQSPFTGGRDDSGSLFNAHHYGPDPQPGLTIRDQLAMTFAAAWVVGLTRRDDKECYTDEDAAYHANRLAFVQADQFLEQRSK
jgi:hypothetical protein